MPKTKKTGVSSKTKSAVKKIVKQAINKVVETKRYDDQSPGAGFVTVDNVVSSNHYNITQMPTGLLDSNRVGDTVMLTPSCKLRFHLTVRFGVNPAWIPTRTRLILYQYHPQVGAGLFPPMADLLLAGVSGGIDTTSQWNHDNRHNYHVIHDKIYTLVNQTESSMKIISINKWGAIRKTLQFVNGGLGGSNHIFIYIMSDQPAGANTPGIMFFNRIWYKDA